MIALTLDQLHGEEMNAVRLLDREDGGDARVVEGGQRLRLPLEPFETLGTRRHLAGQHLEGHVAAEPRVDGAVDLAPPAGADRGGDAVVRERLADQGTCRARERCSASFSVEAKPRTTISGASAVSAARASRKR